MGKIGVFQFHRTLFIFVFFFLAVHGSGPGFRFHCLRQRILTVKQGLQRVLYLVNRPRAAVNRRQHGDQHIGVMLNIVKVIGVFVVIMGAFVVVQIRLQFRFHCRVLRFGGKHILVLAGIGGYGQSGGPALKHGGA